MSKPVFVTGNQDKANALNRFLGMELEHRSVELEEIQGTLQEIVEYKAKQAFKVIGAPVLVEDVSVSFNALDDMPGPYIKNFITPRTEHQTMQQRLETLCRMLDGLEDRSARAECMYGYYDGNQLSVVSGELHGTIAKHPVGVYGFGWDAIFCAEGFNGRTRGQLEPSDDPALYPQIRPWAGIRDMLGAAGVTA